MSTKAITQPEDLNSAPSSMSERHELGFAARLEGDAVVACEGELDPATTPALRRSLNCVLHLAPDRVVVDLSRVPFFDAGAIGELVQARTTSRAAGGDLVVRAPSPLGRRVLDIVGLTDLIVPDPGQTTGSSGAAGDAGAHRDELVAAGRFTAGNRSSVVIDEAKGLIAEHFDIGIDEASTMLRTFSTARRRSVASTAVALMDRTIEVATLAPHRLGPWATAQDGSHQDPHESPPRAGR